MGFLLLNWVTEFKFLCNDPVKGSVEQVCTQPEAYAWKPFGCNPLRACIVSSMSEGSDQTSEISASFSRPAAACSLQKLPGSYLVIFAVNVAAAVLLYPSQDSVTVENPPMQSSAHLSYMEAGPMMYAVVSRRLCTVLDKLFFIGQLLASFGTGCVAAFLVRRFAGSADARLICVYAVINWLQSMLGSIRLLDPRSCSCKYTVISDAGFIVSTDGGQYRLDTLLLYYALSTCRLLLYIPGLILMQALIAARIKVLSEASNLETCCAGWFLHFVVFQAFACVPVVAKLSFAAGERLWNLSSEVKLGVGHYSHSHTIDMSPSSDHGWSMGSILRFSHMIASMMAIGYLGRAFFQLLTALSLAALQDIPTAVKISLRRARRLLALQVTVVSMSLVLKMFALPTLESCWRALHMRMMSASCGWCLSFRLLIPLQTRLLCCSYPAATGYQNIAKAHRFLAGHAPHVPEQCR